MAGGVFISYRRNDNRYAAGRIYDSLSQRFPGDQLFIDVDNIEPGLNFLKVIQSKVAASDAMLVVIGPNWLNSADLEGKRRIDHPEDLVRLEIEAGLKREIRVIPVLVDGAKMPSSDDLPKPLKPLAWHNAVTLHHDSFKHDAERLANALAKAIGPIHKDNVNTPLPKSPVTTDISAVATTKRPAKRKTVWLCAASLAPFAVAIAIIMNTRGPQDDLGGLTAQSVVIALSVVCALIVATGAVLFWRE